MYRAKSHRAAERCRQADPGAGLPHHWPFGRLTESQIRARNAFEAAMRGNRLAHPTLAKIEAMPWPLPEAL